MTQIPDYDNDPSLQGSSGAWHKWEKVGDQLIGVVTGFRKSEERTRPDGNRYTNGVYEITKDDETVINLEVGQTDLKSKFAENRISVGDRIRVTFAEEIRTGKPSPLKSFTVEVQKADTLPTDTAPAAPAVTEAARATLSSKLGATEVNDKAPF